MPTIARTLLLAGIGCLISVGEASAKDKTFCYFHHNCPDDGKIQGLYTKRQCQDDVKNKNGRKMGMSWGDGPTSCENVN
jgi:hypothetical protein